MSAFLCSGTVQAVLLLCAGLSDLVHPWSGFNHEL